MPGDIFQQLKNVRIRGHMMNIAPFTANEGRSAYGKRRETEDARPPREKRETRTPREPRKTGDATPRKRLALKI